MTGISDGSYIEGWEAFNNNEPFSNCVFFSEYERESWKYGWRDAYALYLNTMNAEQDWTQRYDP
jgi:hypothetical protein